MKAKLSQKQQPTIGHKHVVHVTVTNVHRVMSQVGISFMVSRMDLEAH